MKKFYTFKRGSVIMVDFSPQVGSEIKGKHFAIVLTKRDRNTNELLTVIPLTSKYHKYHIDFGNEIYNSIYSKLIDYLEQVIKDYIDINSLIDDKAYKNFILQKQKVDQITNRYELLKEHTYGKPHQITTVSKLRIVKPINNLDPIRQLKVSNEVMEKIDSAIIELFTK